MKNIKRIISILAAAAVILPVVSCAGDPTSVDDGNFNIVTSFYPMQILTMNVAGGIDGVTVNCMSAPDIGCIHDHVFTTEDLRLVENADVYVENGLELESFNDRLLTAYPELTIVEASSSVTDAPRDGEEVNGHVWTSIDDYMIQVMTVSDALSEADPEHASQYSSNAQIYIEKLEDLANRYDDVLAGLEGRGVLVLDESLPSFCVYAGMDYITIETDHEQSALSAGDMREVIEYMNANDVELIFAGADTDSDIAEAVASETGAVIYTLNTCISGDVDADSYITQMEENLELLGSAG